MSDLLSHEEYLSLAASLSPPVNPYIDGHFVEPKSCERFDTINPATGEVIARVASCNSEDVEHAVAKAKEAFDHGGWRTMAPADRKEVLIRLAKIMKRHRHELAVMESLDSGKPIRDCAEIDMPEAINTLIWHAEAIDKIYDQTAPAQPDSLAMIVREPIGVVACILPWNFPLLMLAWKIGPALAAGNSVIVKPAEQTSLTALRIAELALEAGVPRGVLNVVTGFGDQVGEPLGRHPDVDMVSFTGSTETGRCFLNYSADSNLKKVVLECGGKNPAVVLNDAEHLDQVAAHVVEAAFWNMGENCSAASRLIVHESVKTKLLDLILVHIRDWPVGDPLDPRNRLGCLIDEVHFSKVSGYLQDMGTARIIVGGETENGRYVMPTVVDEVDVASALAREEIFGPVLSVITVSSFEEAIKVANDTDYGLTASIFTANNRKAIRAAREIKAGTVTINCYGEGDISTPFGGYKQSGFGGRDNSIYAHDQYTELKTIWIDLSDPLPETL